MATKVYSSEVIELQDGTEVTLAPLPIGRLRRFMDAWEKFGDVEKENDALTVYINCCGIALERELSERVGDLTTLKKVNVLTAEYREYLEETLDMDTIYKVLDVCGGLKLNDPNLIQEMERLALAEAAGTA